MNNTQPPYIEETNLSRAWARVFLHIIDNPGKEISPLLISLTGFEEGQPEEDAKIRQALDRCLVLNGFDEVHTVANTIFPASLWRIASGDRKKLYEMYKRALPRYKALDNRNRNGIYFERLIAYGEGPEEGNQLEFIISQYNARSGVRRSMLQASVFKAEVDHTPAAQQGFPCLQHVTFAPSGGTLTVNGFYATQQLFDKAYGNLLGLVRLGAFMAHEMKLELGRVNCFAGVEKLERIGKRDPSLKPLIKVARAAVVNADSTIAEVA